MNSKNYWRNRAEQYEAEWQNKIKVELEIELAKYFCKAFIEIENDIAAMYGLFSKDDKINYPDIRKPIRGDEFKEWQINLKEYIAEAHTNSKIFKELNILARRLKISRLEKLYTDTLIELQNLGEKSEKAVTDFLTTAYKERYYHGIFDLVKIGNLEVPISKVQPANCEKFLKRELYKLNLA